MPTDTFIPIAAKITSIALDRANRQTTVTVVALWPSPGRIFRGFVPLDITTSTTTASPAGIALTRERISRSQPDVIVSIYGPDFDGGSQ